MPKRPFRINGRNTDRHTLYESSVQSAPEDADLIARIFAREVGRPARTLLEDFCGTAWLCAEWVKRHEENRAVGVDLEGAVLAWGKRKHIDPLGEAKKRVSLKRRNVLAKSNDRFDVVCAYNYSYFIFHERATLLAYFRNARRHLVRDGMFFLDCFGGPAAQREEEDERPEKGFRYIWEQVSFNPVDGKLDARIHYRFRDGTMMRNAFRYDWRLWSLTEIQDLLREAGFSKVHSYWEDEDADGEPQGTFRRRARVDADDSWSCYIVALP